MVITLNSNGHGGYRILFKDGTSKELGLKKEQEIYFYANEHGMFMKPIWPNTKQEEPKNAAKGSFSSITMTGYIEPTLVINSGRVSRMVREKFNIEGEGRCVFQILETSKSDVFEIKFVEQFNTYLKKDEPKEGTLGQKHSIRKKKTIVTSSLPYKKHASEINLNSLPVQEIALEDSIGNMNIELKKEQIPLVVGQRLKDEKLETIDKWNELKAQKSAEPIQPEMTKETFIKLINWLEDDCGELLNRLTEDDLTPQEEHWLKEDFLKTISSVMSRIR